MRRGLLVAFLVSVTLAAAPVGEAKGTVVYTSRGREITLAPTYAYLVTGPDVTDTTRTIRRVILSTIDLSTKIRGCGSMSCAVDDLREGFMVDLGASPVLNYWLVMNKGFIQYTGIEKPASLKTRADTPTRLAGTLTFDNTAAKGPKASVEFDAEFVKSFDRAR